MLYTSGLATVFKGVINDVHGNNSQHKECAPMKTPNVKPIRVGIGCFDEVVDGRVGGWLVDGRVSISIKPFGSIVYGYVFELCL